MADTALASHFLQCHYLFLVPGCSRPNFSASRLLPPSSLATSAVPPKKKESNKYISTFRFCFSCENEVKRAT